MTGIIALIIMGLLVYGIWQVVVKSAPDERRKCTLCGTTKRALQWMKSWEDWYCLRCKEECIRAIVNILIGEHA